MFRKIELLMDKTIAYYKQYGILQFLKRFFGVLGLVPFSRTIIFIVLDLKDYTYDRKKPYSFHLATIEEMQNEQEYQDYMKRCGFTKKEIIYRLQKGLTLFILKENNKMVYFLWMEKKNAVIKGFHMPLHLPQEIVYSSGAYTLPDYRGKGIASKIKKEVFHYLKEEGVKKVLGVDMPENTVALRINKKLGYKEYQTVTYKRYWYIRYYTVQKYSSSEYKTFITLFKAPNDLWKTFL